MYSAPSTPGKLGGRMESLAELTETAPNNLEMFYQHLQSVSVLSRGPHLSQTATIIPVPKHSDISTLSDYRPVAFKCLERLVLKHIKSTLPPI